MCIPKRRSFVDKSMEAGGSSSRAEQWGAFESSRDPGEAHGGDGAGPSSR